MGQIILVVEDNDDLRDEVALVLAAENYTVYTATDGREALDMLERADWRPDLIVSDIAMPRLDGYGFFVAIREIPALRAIPFIFLTARGARHDLHMGRQLGVDDYLVKPFEPEEFLTAVRNKLRRAAEMRERADRELDDARRTMVQLLSHELRTPLTYVTGGFSLLAEEFEQSLTPDAEVSLGLIRSGTSRLNRLAEQMVLYSELVSGHVRLQLESAGKPVDLGSLLNTILALHSRDAEEKQIRLCISAMPDRPLSVFGLNDLLSTAIGEVVRNAISYSPEGGEVQMRLLQEPNYAVIEVMDNGRGIVPQDLAHIWDVLIQSERHRHEQQGAGMGLPIARKIVEAHGGQIGLDSVVDQGTQVTVRLPCI